MQAIHCLLVHLNVDIRKSSVTARSAQDLVSFAIESKERLASFSSLVTSKTISPAMAQKAADSGLHFHHLQLAHHRDVEKGIHNLFTEKVLAASTHRVKFYNLH